MTLQQETSTAPRAASSPAKNTISKALHLREAGVLIALVVLFIIGVLTSSNFASGSNLLSVGQQVAQIGIMAVGATFVIVNGEIDLSVGSIYALSAVVSGMMIADGTPWALAVLCGIVAGAVAGLLNGLAVVVLGIPSFIVTLGTLSVFRGVALLLTDGAPISLNSDTAGVDSFSLLGQGRLFGIIPMQLLIFIAIAGLGIMALSRSRLGYETYAVGGSLEAARLVGIHVGRVKVAAFALSGTSAAIAGVLGLSFLNYVQGVTGTGLELSVISAVIIGGAALFGGVGTMWGTIIGVLFIGLLQNILNINGISSFWQTIVTGLVIIAAVAADTWQRRRRTEG